MMAHETVIRGAAWTVLACYIGASLLGIGIGFFAIRMPRYFPVVTLMGLGMGVPALTLTIIRGARLLGFGDGSDVTNAIALIVAFIFLLGSWLYAGFLVLAEGRRERLERRIAHAARVTGSC